MGMFVIAAYRPHKGKEKALMQAVQEHIPILAKEGLVTDHEPYVMRAKDGTIVEVFAWQSEHAIEAAHSNPAVQQLWARFSACCDYDEIGNVAESKQLFSRSSRWTCSIGLGRSPAAASSFHLLRIDAA